MASELAELLELMYTARRRFRTVRVTARRWHHTERSNRAFERWAERSGSTLYGPPAMQSPPATWEATFRLWFERPSRVREERGGELGIRDGDSWWHYSPMGGAVTNAGDPAVSSPIGQELGHLLDPSELIVALELEPLGATEWAGRPALRVRALLRESDSPPRSMFQLGQGADEYELLVDAQYGVLLRAAARLDGEETTRTEMLEAAFDEELPAETFVFEPPPGVEMRDASRPSEPTVVTIEEAASLAPFRLWILGGLDESWQASVRYFAGSEVPPAPPSVHVHYWRDDALHQVNLTETSVADPDSYADFPWDVCVYRDQELRVWVPERSSVPGYAYAQLERGGTRITLNTPGSEVDPLLTLVDSLVPASG